MTTFVDEVVAVFAARGDSAYLGERVSMSAHMLQTAAAARAADASDSLVVAALLHDIGHLVHPTGNDDTVGLEHVDRVHESVGADWLSTGFGPEVTEPIRLHVAAKRYLCAVEPGYLEALSPASVHTLSLQGGAMSAEEAADFAASPYADAAVTLRRCDDAGKREGVATPPLDHFIALLQSQIL